MRQPVSGWEVLWQEVAEPSYWHIDGVYFDKSAADRRLTELGKQPRVRTAKIERYADNDERSERQG